MKKQKTYANLIPHKIKVGTGLKTADDFQSAIKKSGKECEQWASAVLQCQEFAAMISPVETEIELVAIPIGELGFKKEYMNWPMYHEVLLTAQTPLFGLKMLPLEAGPQLMIQTGELTEELSFFVASVSVSVSLEKKQERQTVFRFDHFLGKPTLLGWDVYSKVVPTLPPDTLFIFGR
ncbi:MAG: hypothetical protein PHG25_01390 [Candidatus Pacebacteria bacterium]|nr:hypothetical protein [Candidatus Paceibacterota bacterium]